MRRKRKNPGNSSNKTVRTWKVWTRSNTKDPGAKSTYLGTVRASNISLAGDRAHKKFKKDIVEVDDGVEGEVQDFRIGYEALNPMRRKRKNPISDLNRYINTPVEKWPFRLKSYSANADGMVNSGILKSGKHFYKKWTYSNGRHSNPRFVLEGERDYGNNPRRRKTRRNHAMLTKGHVRSGAVSSKTLATRRYDAVRAPYSKIHKALMTSMSRGGGQFEALAALRGKRSGMSLSRNPKRRKKNKRGRK